ncbi:hypothetical protein SPURM210S_00931 [Streptomyces purpurascens]
MAEALGGRSVALGPGLPGRLNPLDAAPRPESVAEADWVGEIRKRRLLLLGSLARTILGRDLMPMEHTALDVALDAVVTRAADTHRTPLLGDVAAALNNPHELDEAAGTMSANSATPPATWPTPCGAWSTATWPACSTPPPPSHSIRTRRCSPSTCPASAAPGTTPPSSWR